MNFYHICLIKDLIEVIDSKQIRSSYSEEPKLERICAEASWMCQDNFVSFIDRQTTDEGYC